MEIVILSHHKRNSAYVFYLVFMGLFIHMGAHDLRVKSNFGGINENTFNISFNII